MITIQRGNHRVTVTDGAYELMFKKLGYHIVGQKNKVVDESHEDEHTKVDIETIPISEMTKEQLKEYASIHGIDLSGTKSVREARNAIKKAMEQME